MQPLSGARRDHRQDSAGRRPDGGRPHQQGGRHQRPAGRADRRGRRVEARCRPPQGREAGRRGQDRRPCRRCALQCLPRLHAGVGGIQDRQHGRRVPRHDDDHHEVQPLHLPAFRLCTRTGSGVRPIPGQQARQEMAHRLCRLRLGPIDPRRLCRADQETGRRGRRHHRHADRHRRHDAVSVEDIRRFRWALRHLLRQGRGDDRQPSLRSRPDQEIQIRRRRCGGGIDEPAGARQQDRGVRRHQPIRAVTRSRRSTRRGTRSSSTKRCPGSRRSTRPPRSPTATFNQISRR